MRLVLALALFGASAAVPPSSDPVHLAISQAAVGVPAAPGGEATAPGGTAVTAYLDLVDEAGRPPASLDPAAIAATIGAARATALRAVPFTAADSGVAYIFLVDISRSLSATDMARVREALTLWAGRGTAAGTGAGAGPNSGRDRVALIAFGDRVSTLVDFTADRAAFARAVAQLRPQDETTHLHTAIERAIELARRKDADLPARRVAVLLSDGKDEGSGLKADDVAALVRQDRLPIYTIGYSRLRGGDRRQGFDALLRLARNSGGLFAEASSARIGEIYEAMRRAVTRVFAVTLRCDTCVGDGRLQRLDLQVRTSSRVLSDGIDLRLPATQPRRAATPPPSSVTPPASSPTPGQSTTADDRRQWWVALAANAVLLAGALIAFWFVRRRRAGAARGAEAIAGGASAGAASAAAARSDAGADDGAAAGAAIDGITITCHFLGRHAAPPRTLAVREREPVTIGADPDSAIVIADDPDVAPRHGELSASDGRVILRRLDAGYETQLNGAALGATARYRLESGDLVRVGRTEFRLVIARAHAAATSQETPTHKESQ